MDGRVKIVNRHSFLLGRVYEISDRLGRYRNVLAQLPCSSQRLTYELLFADEAEQLLHVMRELGDLLETGSGGTAQPASLTGTNASVAVSNGQPVPPPPVPGRAFTAAELAQYDGSGGQPAYVAINGLVYDVSVQATWGGGSHFGLIAGRDLTEQFAGCHGQTTTLSRLPVVGTLAPATGGQTA